MPDLYVHMRLARDVLGDDVDETMVALGAMGPDPFYYVIASNQRAKARRLGDAFHEKTINALFATMLDFVARRRSTALESYVYGYLTHFALDVSAHPYVHYHVGDARLEPGSDALHLRFERAIDARLIQEDTGASPDRLACKRFFPVSRVPRDICALIDHIALECFDISGAGDVYALGYRRMRFVFSHLVRDRTGVKTALLSLLDRLRQTGPRFVDVTFRTATKSRFDVLNRDRRVWHHPVSGEPSRKSFDDLYLDAYDEANRLIGAVKAHFETGDTLYVRTLFGNRSLRTGLDVGDARPMHKRYHGRLD